MRTHHSVLVYLRPARLLYVRAMGPYEQSIPRAWDQLVGWLNDNGLYAPIGKGFGLARDNPAEVGSQNCRYDACVKVTGELEQHAMRDLGVATLPGGAYVCHRYSGNYDQIRTVVANAYADFAPLAGLSFDGKRPVVSVYFDNPSRQREADLRADICVPVTVIGETGRSQKVA